MTTGATVLDVADPVTGLAVAGVHAWTTTIENGSFGLGTDEPVVAVMDRWVALQDALELLRAGRLASATQVHGAAVTVHEAGWQGWLRARGVDGHVTAVRGTALAVTVADCTPVFIAHERAIGLLHAGWRGTAAGILASGLQALAGLGCPPEECQVHLGPAICGDCYEVGPEVLSAITGRPAHGKGQLDVRAVLAEQASGMGVGTVTTSASCTRCGPRRFFSHRRGDVGRQIAVMAFL